MTPEALAALHARCFEATPRPWTAAEFAALLALDGVLVVTAPDGFALGRCAGGEAELLTLAVAPEARGRGRGRALVAAFETAAAARGSRQAFLEVAESNTTARRLYADAGYAAAGTRRGYYRDAAGCPVDGLVMRKALAAGAAGSAAPPPHGGAKPA